MAVKSVIAADGRMIREIEPWTLRIVTNAKYVVSRVDGAFVRPGVGKKAFRMRHAPRIKAEFVHGRIRFRSAR